METIFLKILNMSINAGWLILAVTAMRFLLRKLRAPAWTSCLLWALAAVRLVCPVSPESSFSLIPSREALQWEKSVSWEKIIPSETALSTGTASPIPSANSGPGFTDNMANSDLHGSLAPNPAAGAEPLQIWLFPGGILWVSGTVLMLLYALISCIRLYGKIRTAVRHESSVYISEFIDTPFIFGLLHPRVYLPSGMPQALYGPVIAHEQAHLDRLDYLWKILGYLLLTVYWFHPLCWTAYILLCRDLELACDEKVIKNYDAREKKAYSEALLACSLKQHRRKGFCPLAFGEIGVKQRICSVLHYKKPTAWVISAAVLGCAVAAVCFLTDPAEGTEQPGENVSGSFGNADASSGSSGDDGMGQNSGSPEHDSAGQSPNDSENATPSQNSSQTADPSPAPCTSPELLVSQWTNAFVSRNGNHIAALASGDVVDDLKKRDLLSGSQNQYSFGESSPWPMDPQSHTSVCSMDSGRAEINYYAWTSEPHVTVWRETLLYEQQDGEYLVTGEELVYLDDIASLDAFTMAYGSPTALDASGCSYLDTGAWEILGQNAGQGSVTDIMELCTPETAAVKLLNLSDDPDKVKVERLMEEERDVVGLQILFAGEPTAVKISMVQPSGSIWIPVDYRISPLYRFSQLDWDQVRSRRLTGPENPDWKDIIRLARIPEQDIAVYGYNDQDCTGQGVAVDMGGKVNYFDWSYTSPQTIPPRFYWNDKARQLQAALHIYTGTGAAADELHVLPLLADGSLQDNVLDYNGFTRLLEERIAYQYDSRTGLLTLTDKAGQKPLAVVPLTDTETIEPELGAISSFVLGEHITLRVEAGWFPDGSPIAEYEGMPVLEAELLLTDRDGRIQFSIGEINVISPT